MNHNPIPIAVKSVAIVKAVPRELFIEAKRDVPADGEIRLCMISGHVIIIKLRSIDDAFLVQSNFSSGCLRLLVGDESELDRFDLNSVFANLVQMEIHSRTGSIGMRASIVGLPPVFITQWSEGYAITTPLMPPRELGLFLGGLDLEGSADVIRWGYPIDGRTLARNVSLVDASASICIDEQGVLGIIGPVPFSISPEFSSYSLHKIIISLCESFSHSAARMNCDRSVISLSGGIDSRAASVALMKNNSPGRFVTLAANENSLEAKLARAFCERYGAEHSVVQLGKGFVDGIADRLIKTARMTYGVSILSQSIDVYLYEQIGSGIVRRITGNLGNQIGRGGVEALSTSDPERSIWSDDLGALLDRRACVPWFIERMNHNGFARVLFQQEISYSSTPNFVVGSHFAVQQSPYACRRQIELASAMFARSKNLRWVSRRYLKFRDLRHRICGTPISRSFQRQYLTWADELAADVPLNWGWKARGGWAKEWIGDSLLTAVDAASESGGSLGKIMTAIRRPTTMKWRDRPFHLVNWPRLIRYELKDFVHDVLGSQVVRHSGAFDIAKLNKILSMHYTGERNFHSSIVRALEIGSACLALSDANRHC